MVSIALSNPKCSVAAVPRSIAALGGGPEKDRGSPCGAGRRGRDSAFAGPKNFDVSTAFPSPPQCLQAAISPGLADFIMTEKSALGMGPDKSAKFKAGDAGKDTRAKDLPAASAVKSETTGSGSHSSPKKRRKVNHGKLPLRAACDRDRFSDY